MKYLKKIETKDDLTTVRQRPNLVLVNSTKEVLYNAVPNGFYIEHIDSTLYTLNEWETAGFEGDLANGVAVITDDCRFVISKEDAATSVEWSNSKNIVQGVTIATNNEESYTDYEGKSNTLAMLIDGNQPVANACDEYVFPNGKRGYLPAQGEWKTVFENITSVRKLLSAIGAEPITQKNLWSSTQYSEEKAFECYLENYGATWATDKKQTRYYARAFTTL